MTDLPINGSIKYTPAQFRELEKEGKLADPKLRDIALGGMRMADRWEVMTDAEREAQQVEWGYDVEHFEGLKVRNLVSRHIRGEIAKFYNIRVGLNAEGAVARHYYPRYEQGEVIWAMDNDEKGMEATKELCRLFPSRSYVLKYPKGCKDANQCLMTNNHQEFVDAWFNAKPASEVFPSAIKAVGNERDRLKAGRPAAGLSWPWPKLNKITLGIRPNQLIVVGAGSGVGKTEFLREVVYKLVEDHNEPVGIISTEDPYVKVARSLLVMRRWKNRAYLPGFEAMGIRKILIDNLTGIQLPEKEYGGKVGALDECVKRVGQIKDRKPVTIFLVTHLNRPEKGRTPHEEGGEVMLRDLRGSGSIGFGLAMVSLPPGRLREAEEWEQVRRQKEQKASAVPQELPPAIEEDVPPFDPNDSEF
ncbi:hypothetical protein GH714_043915 [Hevea brasiliensis]|uniref:SF4 helicase domain-containing protein n=1 Tax=Hevea brasiliensis TaxID=3981 RepID=A0A6A6K1P9_HEVBR|nr:hypothetical protein GH714_043915 [Hevea brasiliensis]